MSANLEVTTNSSTICPNERYMDTDVTCFICCVGIWEELYCAIDSRNAIMRPALLMSAVRHVESYVRVSVL